MELLIIIPSVYMEQILNRNNERQIRGNIVNEGLKASVKGDI